MKTRALKYAVLLAVLALLSLNFCDIGHAVVEDDTVRMDVNFPEPRVAPSAYSPGYSRIEMKGLASIGNPGEPVLPVKGLNILIPPGKDVKDAEVILGEKVTLPGKYMIEPGQRPYPLSMSGNIKIEEDKPNPEIYESESPYPAESHKLVSVQRKLGYQIAVINLFPVEYVPRLEQISYYKSMSVKVKLKPETAGKYPQGPATDPIRKEEDKKSIRALINNKEDI